jgi:hypothetical protein
MSDAQIFDPENYLLQAHQSPGLEPVKPSLEVVETPPPIATEDSSAELSEDEEDEGSNGNERSREQQPPQVDHVLGSVSRAPVSSLAPTKRTLDLMPPSIQTKPLPEEDSISQSPTLARFTIGRADGDPSNILPAMLMSPPRSSSRGSPEINQTLPSLTAALSDAGAPLSAHSPNLTHALPGQMYGRSPYSAKSPPSLPSHPSFWRIPTASDYAVGSTSESVLTPASSIVNQSSAASHPTPTTTSLEARLDGSPEQVLSPESDGQETNGNDSLFSSNSYKCTIPGCTTAPFKTQYLLNSHMNVHLDTRLYFCPVEGCTRGPSGQGFKRKNEMKRWDILHTHLSLTILTATDMDLCTPHRAICALSARSNSANILDQITSSVMSEYIISTKTETIPRYEKSLLNDLTVVAENGGGGQAPDGIYCRVRFSIDQHPIARYEVE